MNKSTGGRAKYFMNKEQTDILRQILDSWQKITDCENVKTFNTIAKIKIKTHSRDECWIPNDLAAEFKERDPYIRKAPV